MDKKFTLQFFLLILVCIAKLDCIGQCTTPVTLSLNITPESCLGCCDGNIQVIPTGGCPAYSYSITPTTSFNNFCSGNYTVFVQDAGCCPVVTQTTSVGTPTSIKEIESVNKILVGPNPSKGEFLFNGSSKETIYIFNSIGRQVALIELNEENNYSCNLTLKESGVYFAYGNKTHQKLVVLK